MGYVKFPTFLQDEVLLSGLCVSPWDMQFYGLREEQDSWCSPRECPSGLVRVCEHQMLSFICWRVINSLRNACLSQVTSLLFYECDIFKSISANVMMDPEKIPAWSAWRWVS